MILIGTITFPEERANDVAQCYSTLPKVPDYITVVGTYVYNTPGEDKRAFSIFEFDEAHLEGATKYFISRYEAFGKVKDLSSSLEEWLNVQDALEVVAEGDFNINTLSSSDFF
jgi:hypothetical protein